MAVAVVLGVMVIVVLVADVDVGERLGEGKEDGDEAHAGVEGESALVVSRGAVAGAVVCFVSLRVSVVLSFIGVVVDRVCPISAEISY